ncbi:MAG: serine/threonine protein kinase, partial [Acidimicrobiia bacterium]|nr:serine/threonine protein kinase [Acidimicrobiia bacterium]
MEAFVSSTAPVIPGIEMFEPVGRGGFSVVYRGRQPDLEREVAVKVISMPGTVGKEVERWQREIAAMGRLSNHPNILTPYTGGVTDDGSPYLVMPYVPGGSLGDRLRSRGPMPPDDVAAIGAKLASALASAHAAGVLHRDVKPDNVLVSPYGEPQLTDFGIARLLDATATATRTIHATIPYAAPEVLSGQRATEAADVYGLAATLFACLTGAAPFPSGEDVSLVALVSRIVTQPPPDMRGFGVPEDLAAAIERGLAKEPADRFAGAADFSRALDGVGGGADVARPDPPTA